jgi:molybdopterin converting factor small subunit
MTTIRVTVRYLGTFSQLAGRREESVELEEGATVELLARRLVQAHGRELKRRLEDASTRPVLFVVRERAVEPSHLLADGDEVLLTYPAGGG